MFTSSRMLTLSSSQRRQLIDITSDVRNFVNGGQVRNGLCVISAPHATAAVIVNEHENGLMKDILQKIEEHFPESPRYAHNAIDDNADAHLAAAFLGHSKTFSIIDHKLVRGTWQSIFLVELDGPRSRRDVCLQSIGQE